MRLKIAIVGVGNVGSTLARSLGEKGHSIFLGVRDQSSEKMKMLASEIGRNATLHSPQEAVRLADVTVLATPWPATEEVVKSLGDFQGKPLVDCTNPLKKDLSGLTLGFETSGAKQIQDWAENAKVVKGFNTTGFNIMAEPVVDGRKAAMFYCGDDSSVNKLARVLIEDVGFEAIEAGPLSSARYLEPMALLWIAGAYKFGLGRDYAFGILRRPSLA